jgi:hypothetical protein
MFGNTSLCALAAAVVSLASGTALAQSSQILCQPVECGTFRELTQAEKDRLQDPFFRLVLAPRPTVRKVTDVEQLLSGATGQSRFFVVDEAIKSSAQPASRRAAMDFTGTNGTIALSANVFLSFSFRSSAFPETPDLEVLAWDEVNGTYNYYKLDDEGASSGKVWKLSATSRNVDDLSPSQRSGTCLACHASGVPIMKELLFPWNNWHSGQSPAGYLQQGTPGSWPVAADRHFGATTLFKGEDFEASIQNAIGRSNKRRFSQLVTTQTDGKLAVADARRVLRPLFETTEVNLSSARQTSGLHPLSGVPQNGPAQAVGIPNNFFLASAVLTSAGIGEAGQFRPIALVQPADYKKLIETSGVQINARPVGRVRGDTHFAWFTPDQGFVATDWINLLVTNGAISKEFAAAAAAADLETPIFSEERAKLLRFIPTNYVATPGEAHPTALTRSVIAALEASSPPSGSVAAEFLETLKSPDPIAAVRARVQAYKNRIEGKLAAAADESTRNAELKRLFDLLIERRRKMIAHPLFGPLVESEALLPMP